MTSTSSRTVYCEKLYDRTPTAQAYRRSLLTPDAIRKHLTDDWAVSNSAAAAAIGLIEVTGMLECSPAERVELIDRILDILAEVSDKQAQ